MRDGLETSARPRPVALRAAQWLALAGAELILLALGPCLLLLADYFTYGAGPMRFAALALLFGLVAIASSGRWPLRSVLGAGAARCLLIALALYATWSAGTQFLRDVQHPEPCWTDMGRPSVCAGEMMRSGINPWATCAPRPRRTGPKPSATMAWCLQYGGCADYKGGGDYGPKRWKHHGPGFDFMDGYKYGPLMALLYLPATHARAEAGIGLINFVFWLALVPLLLLLARAAYPRVPGAAARALLVLMLPAVLPAYRVLPHVELEALGRRYVLEPPLPATFVRALTSMCANDLIPVFFALLAGWLARRARAGDGAHGRGASALAGIALGLSLATKQLPGLLLLLPLARMKGVDGKRFAFAAAITAALFYYAFFASAPREMIANLILFNFARPTNSSSIRRFMPRELEPLVSLAQLALTVWLVARFWRAQRRDLAAVLRTAVLLVIGFIALNKVVHGNYFLWIQPLLALVMAGAPFAARDEPAPTAPERAAQ